LTPDLSALNSALNAICTPDPGFERALAALEAELRAGDPRSELHGKRLAVKDNIEVEGLPTTVGSRALAGNVARRDAPVVARLRAAGLAVVGKSNLSEWAGMRDGGQASGWSGFGGLTRNPYALNRSAGGSSAGSGAAVAAGLADVALGTETDGSITWPAAFTGCVGVKPTVGLVPTSGLVPVSSAQDSIGPIARSVGDAAAMLAIMSAGGADFREHAARRRLDGVRVGVPRAFWRVGAHAEAAAERALDALSKLGADIVDGIELQPMDEETGRLEMIALLCEMRAELDEYLRHSAGPGPKSLDEVVAYNETNAATEFEYCGQELLLRAAASDALDSRAYRSARAACTRRAREDGIDRALRAHGLDALVSPPYGPAFPIDMVGAEPRATPTTTIAALAGYPLVTVPSGTAHSLPLAISFWGTAGSEGALIGIAAAYEAARIGAEGPFPRPRFSEFR